ncbi:MAG: hypothetical protein QM640_16695 [Niabella sp.]
MKKLLLIVILVAAAFLIYKYAFKKNAANNEKEAPRSLAVRAHSREFDQSVNDMLSGYYGLTDGFVNWDSAAVNTQAARLETALKGVKTDELRKDTAIYQTALFPLDNAKGNVSTILTGNGWEEKRRGLQELSENLRMFLITIKYNKDTVYWQECPMAFGENTIGNWLSAKATVVNPYLGRKDPQFGATMINCGETKEKIYFATDSSIK